MSTATPQALLEQLNWRYATKRFDPSRIIPDDVWSALEEALVLTPSSYGLQPWKFLILTDRPSREPLVSFSWGQRQVADSSHLVVFAVRTNLTEADVDRYISTMARLHGKQPEALAGYRRVIVGDVVTGDRGKAISEWAARQAYIALGNLMTSAAMLGVDTCPMEGFQPAGIDAALGLAERGLTSVLLCPVGYRSPDDKYAALPKVRYPKEEIIERL